MHTDTHTYTYMDVQSSINAENMNLRRKGAWTSEEDALLKECIGKYGVARWSLVPSRAGLNRCPKSCRLRWLNYLCPGIKRGRFEDDESDLIIRLHKLLGNRWSLIAGRLPGRTANDIKNYWNTHLGKRFDTAKDDKEGPATHADHVLKPKPQAIPLNWSWSKEGPKPHGKQQQHQVESDISKQSSSSYVDTAVAGNGLDPLLFGHVDSAGRLTEEIEAKLGIDDVEILRDDDKLFVEGFKAWEDLLLDTNLWDDS